MSGKLSPYFVFAILLSGNYSDGKVIIKLAGRKGIDLILLAIPW